MYMAKNLSKMNKAELTILNYLQMAEYRKYNDKDYTPIDGIEILREMAEKLDLIEKRPEEAADFGEMPF